MFNKRKFIDIENMIDRLSRFTQSEVISSKRDLMELRKLLTQLQVAFIEQDIKLNALYEKLGYEFKKGKSETTYKPSEVVKVSSKKKPAVNLIKKYIVEKN